MELVMATIHSRGKFEIDAQTGRAIARGVGEKLEQLLADHPAQFPTRLQVLLDQLRAQEKSRSGSADSELG